MKVGDLVREKYPTKRIGIIVAIVKCDQFENDRKCQVQFIDGDSEWKPTWHYWRLGHEGG